MGDVSKNTILPSEFLNWMLLRGLRQTTAYTRKLTIIRLLKNNVDLALADSFKSYMAKLLSLGRAASYINIELDAIRDYSRFCKEKNYPYDEEVFKIRELKIVNKPKATMSDDEIEAFLALPREGRGSPQKGWDRWTLFYSICAFTGCRPGEAAHLTVDRVDFGRGVFVFTETKTHDNRLVPIPDNVVERLKKHMETCDKLLFPSDRGGNKYGHGAVIDNVDWHYNFHTRIKKLGIRRPNLSPYSLRHSLITRLLEEDVNMGKVQKIVGHKRIETTAIYTHMTTKDIILAIRKHPLIRKQTDPNEKIKMAYEAFNAIIEGDPRIDYEKVIINNGVTLKAYVPLKT